jgi:thiamine kinase-like enzyme
MVAYENELTVFLKKVNEYKTTNIIREEIEFQKRLRFILEGLQEQFEPFIEGGINLFGVISQPNGFAQVFKAARENLNVQLDKLLEKEAELTQQVEPLDLKIPEYQKDPNATSGQVNLEQPGKVTPQMVQ